MAGTRNQIHPYRPTERTGRTTQNRLSITDALRNQSETESGLFSFCPNTACMSKSPGSKFGQIAELAVRTGRASVWLLSLSRIFTY